MGDDVKRISPINGIAAMASLVPGAEVPGREDVFRHEEPNDGFVVDTCAAFDTYEWETGIFPNALGHRCIVVEQYENREDAAIGHQKWVESMKTDPTQELTEIYVWEGLQS